MSEHTYLIPRFLVAGKFEAMDIAADDHAYSHRDGLDGTTRDHRSASHGIGEPRTRPYGSRWSILESDGRNAMILTNQLVPAEDRRAQSFLDHYGETYNCKPSYFAHMFAGRCHVADSYLDVIRHGWSQISEDSRKDPDKRETRREFILQLVSAHFDNRELVRHFRF